MLVNDVLLVRNGEEMAAFRLTRAGDTQDDRVERERHQLPTMRPEVRKR